MRSPPGDGSSTQVRRTGSPFASACSALGRFWTVCGVDRLTPISGSRSASCAGPELRPLPSIGITRLHRYYEPLRHPKRPRLSLAGCRFEGTSLDRWGFPCCAPSPCTCMPSPLPRRDRWMIRSSRPAAAAFPKTQVGRLPHCVFRGLLSVHSYYGLHARRVAMRPYYTEGFGCVVTSATAPVATGRSDKGQAGISPAEHGRLFTAH